MTLIFIQFATSVTGAVIAIVALLLVAAIIGYFTSWFYAKSVYTPVIKGLEAEKADLLKQVAGLKDDLNKLNSKVDKLNGKIGNLEEEIAEKDKEIKSLKKPKK
jgi:peptidoglycan hydrolase CwlO-like protein